MWFEDEDFYWFDNEEFIGYYIRVIFWSNCVENEWPVYFFAYAFSSALKFNFYLDYKLIFGIDNYHNKRTFRHYEGIDMFFPNFNAVDYI